MILWCTKRQNVIAFLIFITLVTSASCFQTTNSNTFVKVVKKYDSSKSRQFVASTSSDQSTDFDRVEESSTGLGTWIPIGSASALSGLTPLKLEMFGNDYVVWEPSDGKSTSLWSVMRDVCPHRLVALSQGRVDPDTGCLECPYHGLDGNLILMVVSQYCLNWRRINSQQFPKSHLLSLIQFI